MSNVPLLLRVAPPLFVLIWSTGWIVAGFAAEFADPLTFLSARYTLAGACLIAFATLAGATWPRRGMDWVHAMVSGVLLHAIYLGGVWGRYFRPDCRHSAHSDRLFGPQIGW